MKKLILLFLILSITALYPQEARQADIVKEKTTIKLPVSLNKEFKISVSALNESFEGSDFPPAGWSHFVDGGTGWSREAAGISLPGWGSGTITTPPGGGNFVAYCTWNGDNTYNNQWLISPLVQDIQSNDRLYFWLRRQLEYADTVYMYYSTDGTNFNWMGQVNYAADGDTNWGLWFINIGQSITAGSDVYIGFREFVADNRVNGAAISLDLIYTVSYPTTININRNFAFGDPARSDGYRMVSLPGITNRLANTGITGEQKKDWNIFDDNGALTGTFLVEFNGSANFNFSPGKGFWMLSRNAFTVNQNVNPVALTDGYFAIPLHSGWNIIGNPFEKNVNWSSVQNLNGVAQPIHLFEGTYSQPPLFEPFKAYYYNNVENHSSLRIPYNYNPGKSKTIGSNNFRSDHLKIKLTADGKEKSSVSINIDPEALPGYDRHDIYSPPGDFEETKIVIFNDYHLSYKYLMVDSRNRIEGGQIYNLELKNSSGKSIRLKLEGIENFPDDEIFIFDQRSKKSYNVKLQNKIDIPSVYESGKFQVLIGTKDFVESQKIRLIPKEFKLHQNFPNPFNPSTKITLDLPLGQNINLFIYNILGEKIKTLHRGYLEPGRHEFFWDGTNESNINLPSDVYIYSVEGMEIKTANKMVLIR